jgi:arginine decarboxylase-like protein
MSKPAQLIWDRRCGGRVQISNIRIIKEAMREASYLYAELVALGAAMGTLDVGGRSQPS